jgi:hypothetical protein
MDSKYSIERFYRVFEDGEGTCIEVGPDADGLDCVQVSTSGESTKHYGELRLILSPEHARKLGQAMINSAEDVTLALAARQSGGADGK